MDLIQDYDNLQLELELDWLTVWFNRPDNRNALSDELVGELRGVLDALVDDRSVRGVTLRGRGGVFCAGGDLKAFRSVFQGGEDNAAEVAGFNRAGGELFDQINALPQVVVMVVEGAAMAGGLGMLCCADVVIVTADARFALTETTLGIPPAQIAPFVAERLGLRTARRLMLTAARFGGDDAVDLGLADFVAREVSELDELEQAVRRQVRKCAPGANAVTKEILLATRRLDRAAMLDFAAAGFARCMLSDEGREGIAAFVEKRKPAWAASVAAGEDSA
jgi:isohexenylglutaconyl-CoA hydratase